jgi:Fic family protein
MPRTVTRTWRTAPGTYEPRAAPEQFPYEATVPDEVARVAPRLSTGTTSLIVDAEKAIAALNVGPSRAVQLEVLARRLLRAESVASSWIEGIRLSQRKLARAELEGAAASATARAVFGNIAAMESVTRLAPRTEPLALHELLQIHRLLMEQTPDSRGAGELRQRQNWIGDNPYSPRGASYVPPPPEEVPRLMEDLLRFIARDDLAATLQAGIAHAQFEAIHPFADGNGRVGRAIIHYVLRRRGAAPRFVPPVSLVLAARSRTYTDGLNAFATGRIEAWIDVFAHALTTAARQAGTLAEEIADLQGRWRERAGHPRRDSSAEALITLLPAHPVLTVDAAAKLLGRSGQAANEALATLEKTGVVKNSGTSQRRRAFEADELLQLVDMLERELLSAS